MNSFREDHLSIHKLEDQYKWMIHFSKHIDNTIDVRNHDINVIFKLYKDKYDNLDSIIENLFDATRPAVDYDKKISYIPVELSYPSDVCKEVCSTNCIIYQLNTYYPENEDFVQVHIYAKRC